MMVSRAFLSPALVLVSIMAVTLAAQSAAALETAAREAFLVDLGTGAVLLDKNADERMPPASMSKIMTVYMVFSRLKSGRLSLDDELPVSEKAWRKGGSKMFVEVGNRVRVEDLLRGVIIQSGNDACIVLAEGLSGSEEAFAQDMNRAAAEIGLTGSHFANSTGWPDPEHWMTARDLAVLAEHLILDFPEYYHLYSELEFTWADIRQTNRNPLLYKNIGADGLKTGHTEEAGYGLTASAVRGDRRLVLVVTGLDSVRARAEESERLLEWGFREFDNYKLLSAGETIAEAAVWLGQSETVPLTAAKDVVVTLARNARPEMKVTLAYDGPVAAPIKAGDTIARLIVTAPDSKTVEVPLMAAQDVEKLGAFGQVTAAAKYMIFGKP